MVITIDPLELAMWNLVWTLLHVQY